MSNPDLPPELLDHVVGLLHNVTDELKNCCLVSKSWIPRTRKHLFADVAFSCPSTFPNPFTSPVCYARSLLIKCPQVITTMDVEEDGWIPTFPRVVHLKVETWKVAVESVIWLLPLHGFTPVIRSLHAVFFSDHSLHVPFLLYVELISCSRGVKRYKQGVAKERKWKEYHGVVTGLRIIGADHV